MSDKEKTSTKNRIKELREERGITLTEMANDINESVQTVNNWEKRYSGLPFSKAEKVAQYFHVSFDYLYCRDNDEDDARPIVKTIARLTDEEAMQVDEYARFLISKRGRNNG